MYKVHMFLVQCKMYTYGVQRQETHPETLLKSSSDKITLKTNQEYSANYIQIRILFSPTLQENIVWSFKVHFLFVFLERKVAW